jgi:CheY-like chemotaxis protein/KaiC/GvpD/RAD55 family RecA-like ATPase
MKSKLPNIVPSGIEPVDKLIGGLESNQLYLVHGEASGKSLFGIKFLIEGLKRGENGALVIRYSPEDAVRRFARLGYDCLEDVYSGRLVILEYSNDIIQQIARLRELTPVLRELEWLLGETRAERLVFDPVTNLVVGEEGNLESRVREFASWATSFGATVVLIANAENEEVIEEFRSLVQESFRFEVHGEGEQATRLLAFEKSTSIPDQAIEIDPSRGVFLLGRQQAAEHIFSKFQVSHPIAAEPEHVNIEAQEIELVAEEPPATAEAEITAPEITAPEITVPENTVPEITDLEDAGPKITDEANTPITVSMQALGEEPLTDVLIDEEPAAQSPEIEAADTQAEPEPVTTIETGGIFGAEIIATDEPSLTEAQQSSEPYAPEGYYSAAQLDTQPLSAEKAEGIFNSYKQATQNQTREPIQAQSQISESPQVMFSDLLDELSSDPSPLELDELDEQPAAVSFGSEADFLNEGEVIRAAGLQDESQAEAEVINEDTLIAEVDAMTERNIDAMVTARAVEILLRPPDWGTEAVSPVSVVELPASAKAAPVGPEAPQNAQPKDFKVLVIDDDASSCEAVAHTLSDYTVEVVHDGVSGLAKLISFKPDLIILDVDLPIIDGFKVLAHIRTSLNMPIIIISGSHMRASDRVLAAELGADYYLTKPFSVKELRQKARQLIARYRGIASWIITSPAASEPRAQIEQKNESQTEPAPSAETAANYYAYPVDEFLRYEDFVAQVEKSVKSGIDNGTSFSIVGCRLPDMTANGGLVAYRLYELVHSLVRETDMVSTNPRNDLVILLADADTTGARAFIARMREQIVKEMNQEPTVWVRSFPDLEETTDSTPSGNSIANATPNRRATDRSDHEGDDGGQSSSSSGSLNARSASIS